MQVCLHSWSLFSYLQYNQLGSLQSCTLATLKDPMTVQLVGWIAEWIEQGVGNLFCQVHQIYLFVLD